MQRDGTLLTCLRPTGGATVTAPVTWDHNDLKVYYQLTPPTASRIPTRALPAATSIPLGRSNKLNVEAIAGGTAGGLVFLAAVLGLVLLCLHRKKKSLKEGAPGAPAPPAELAATPLSHELSTAGTSKYSAAQDRMYHNDQLVHPAFVSGQPRCASYEYTSLRTGRLRPLHNTAAYNAQHDSWSQQASASGPTPSPQYGYSYPTPTSPQQLVSPASQQSQVYYPPPEDFSQHGQASHMPVAGQSGSPHAAQYGGDGDSPNISTTTTPAHFYAQVVAPDYET
jgi:hypothetical protein